MSWVDAIEKHRTRHHCQYGIDDAKMCRDAHFMMFLLLLLSRMEMVVGLCNECGLGAFSFNLSVFCSLAGDTSYVISRFI